MWGQAFLSLSRIHCPRIIPTRVGTSYLIDRHTDKRQDHPHACGDKKDTVNNEIRDEGSSPRVWGQVERVAREHPRHGIIPTRVGTSVPMSPARYSLWDHPHACGDKSSKIKDRFHKTGSSPRVWGQGLPVGVKWGLIGIIPTRVGTRPLCHRYRYRCWDHPHACGDKVGAFDKIYLPVGSSPRVWGQEMEALDSVPCVRIIPTRVGTSGNGAVRIYPKEDHPHACGDKHRQQPVFFIVAGSSPRVWGQDQQILYKSYERRIIPTRVGTRLKKSRKIAVLQNQPLRFPLTFHRSFV